MADSSGAGAAEVHEGEVAADQDDTQFCRSAVADNTLTIKQKSILPVSKTRQDKSLFRSLSGVYPPPVESGFVCPNSLATREMSTLLRAVISAGM